MDVLLTFTGFHDPYSKGLIDQGEQPGPILSLLAARPFDRVFLFDTPNTRKITEQTSAAILRLYPQTAVYVLDAAIDDPTDYEEIFTGIRTHLKQIFEDLDNTRVFVSTASGTPQMHACWILMTASGEIPAHVLHIRPPRFVTRERPLISEINLCAGSFPTVRVHPKVSLTKVNETDLEAVRLQIGILGEHPSIKHVIEIAAMLSPSRSPILILGETGAGKELFARFIHRLSGRIKGPLVTVNCAAIPQDLVESLLFGHKRGAFSGAIADQQGKFDAADKGTLFLDELGELPMPTQAKLLRVLQDGMVETIGQNRPHRVDVRILAATNRDLKKLVNQNKFREDLFYRLNVGEIRLPSLKERRSDIPVLALHVLDTINSSLRQPKRLSTAALSRLQSHSWPGNVRDLENVIERSVRLCRNEVLGPDDLLISDPAKSADPFDALPEPYEGFSLDSFLGSARKQMLLRALAAANGNQSKAARLLGITPQAVHKFLQQSKSRS